MWLPSILSRRRISFIALIRARYSDASHHCYAFVVGPPGSTARVGQSDDGEPHGTAGRPMLNVLLHTDVGDIVAVVTRYFGGTKLGKGGLVRAYGQAVQAALAEVSFTIKVDWMSLTISISYAQSDAVRRLYASFEAELLNEAFADVLQHRVRLPRTQRTEFIQAIRDATRGQAVIEEDEQSA